MKVIVSCHQDRVRHGVLRSHPSWTVWNGRIRGMLDNSLTCAVVASLLPHLPKGVEVRFTEGEERGWPNMTGANAAAREVKRRKEPTVVVVVDVCPERKGGRGGSKRPEVVVSNWWGIKATDVCMAAAHPYGTRGRVGMEHLDFKDEDNENECWTYARLGVPCVAIELPVHGDFHTTRASCPVRRINGYTDALLSVVRRLSVMSPEHGLLFRPKVPSK